MIKNKIKKMAVMLMIVFCTVALAGCAGSEEPKDVVNTFMGSLKQYNIAKPMMLMVQSENGSGGTKGNGDFSKVDFKDKTTNDYLKAMLTNIEYKIISVDQQGKEATVKAEIKTVDAEALMKNVMAEKAKEAQVKMQAAGNTNAAAQSAATANNVNASQQSTLAKQDMSKMSDEQLKAMEKTLIDAINNSKDIPKKTSTIEVKLEKEKGEWKVRPTDKLMKLIFGAQ